MSCFLHLVFPVSDPVGLLRVAECFGWICTSAKAIRRKITACLILLAHQSDIEARVGTNLKWERLDHHRACRIAVETTGAITDSPEKLESVKQWALTKNAHVCRCPPAVSEICPWVANPQPLYIVTGTIAASCTMTASPTATFIGRIRNYGTRNTAQNTILT